MEMSTTWWAWIALALIVLFNAGLIGGLCLVLWRTYKTTEHNSIRITAFIGLMVVALVTIAGSLIATLILLSFPAYTVNESYTEKAEFFILETNK